MLLGLRGVGKTVLLNRLAENAEALGYHTIMLEAPEDRGLAEMLVPPLRSVLLKISPVEKATTLARRALGMLRGFASVFKVKVGEVEFGVDAASGTADSGNLEADLPELLLAVGRAAKAADRPVALFTDEIQYLKAEDLSALIVSDHKIGQQGLPFIVFGAGLPMIAALAGDAKSYAERLFDYPDVGALEQSAAESAIREPLKREGVEIEQDALALIVEKTQGYPYFLQEWGFHAWKIAAKSPITLVDVGNATHETVSSLDKSFFRVRYDRLTHGERAYMRAMAALGPGPHRSGDIADALGIKTTSAAPTRSGLIKKGMLFSPQYGDTAFTVPMFDDFMRRSMPNWKRGSSD